MNSSSLTLDYKQLFESLPGNYLILLPDFTIAAMSDIYAAATKTVRENIVGKGVFEVFPDDPKDPDAHGVANLTASLNRALTSKKPDKMPTQKYNIPTADGGFEERYWEVENFPLIVDNKVILIINAVIDVTHKVLADLSLQRKIEELRLMNESMINREVKMVELKKEIAALQQIILKNNLSVPS